MAGVQVASVAEDTSPSSRNDSRRFALILIEASKARLIP